MSGHLYKRLIAQYVVHQYGSKVRVYDEVNIGTSIIGKQRRVDFLIVEPATQKALAVECKFQDSLGTADEKIPYTLQDLKTLRMPATVVYAGNGFSDGVLHLLQSSEYAAYCLPGPSLQRIARQKGAINSGTWQFDHVLAVTFCWWDLLIGDKPPLSILDDPSQVFTSLGHRAPPPSLPSPSQSSEVTATDSATAVASSGEVAADGFEPGDAQPQLPFAAAKPSF